MSLAGNIYDSGAVRLEFLRTSVETSGELHEMRATYAPGSPLPPAHLHPGQDERFEVEEGALTFVVDGVEQVVAAGEGIDIPRGAVHQVRNAGEIPAVTLWQTRPALRTGEFHHELNTARSEQDWDRLAAALTGFGDVFVVAPESS